MNNKNTKGSLPLFASAPYFSKEDFQFPVTAVNKTITETTVMKNNSGITMLFFRNGPGKVIVNTREYKVHKGFLLILGAYHYHQFCPENVPLELTQCNLSYDTFLYMSANPYYKFTELTMNVDPLTSLLEGTMLKRTEKIIDELVAATIRHHQKGGETEFFLCMRLMGIMQKTHNKKIWD